MAVSESEKLFRKIKLVADQIAKIRAVLDRRWKDLATRLEAAIKAKDRDKIEFFLSALDGRIKEVSKTLQAARVAMGDVRELQLDEDFVAGNAVEMEEYVSILSGAVKSLTAQFAEGKKLQNQAQAAAESATDAAGNATALQAELETAMNDAKGAFSALFKKADAIQVRAAAALKARDAKALARAKAEYDALGIDVQLMLHEGLLKRVKELGASAGSKEYAPDVQAQLKDGAKDLMNQAVGVNVYVDQLKLGVQRMKAMAIEAPDSAKAAKLLSLDRAAEEMLKKVLAGPAAGLEPGLEQIGRKLDPKQKGKDMLAKLRSAGIL
ncbi:MAG TPA: hypothetical protein VHM00_05660 [Caldimonas sp.]|jgi:hypothetical protein|nr:hypothetical protein [Caldimonas sp.]HEX2540551.1 hypothetical protein [Caldimonas sp.]